MAGFLLSFREGLEMALVIGVILSALHKIGRADLEPVVWRGTGAAIMVSLLVAVGLTLLGAGLVGQAEVIFEGSAMLLAAGILTWMIFWMQRQAGMHAIKLESNLQAAVLGGHGALFMLAFVAVVREGLELALYLVAAGLVAKEAFTVLGVILGLLIATFLGWLLFKGFYRLSLSRFFQVTNILLVLFAAGLVAHGVRELNEINLVPSLIEHVWNLTSILNENSILGGFLSTLFGYSSSPSLVEVLSYVGYILFIFLAGFLFYPKIKNVTVKPSL